MTNQCPLCGNFSPYNECYSINRKGYFHINCKLGRIAPLLGYAAQGTLTEKHLRKLTPDERKAFAKAVIRLSLKR